MSPLFIAIALLIVLSAAAAISLRNLVHCALSAALSFGGLAAMFLHLGAPFVGFAQLLVYVGAVAILILFAILLTRGIESSRQTIAAPAWWIGLGVAGLVWASLTAAVLMTPLGRPEARADVSHEVAVRTLGQKLMTDYVLPLEIAGLLLTAAAIGAVIIALHETKGPA